MTETTAAPATEAVKAKKAPNTRPKMHRLPPLPNTAPNTAPPLPEATQAELAGRLAALDSWTEGDKAPPMVPPPQEASQPAAAPAVTQGRILPWASLPEAEMKSLNTKVLLRTHSKISVLLSHYPGKTISDIVAPALDRALDEQLKALGYE